MIDEYTQAYKTCFLTRWAFFLVGMWMFVFNRGENDLSSFLRWNDVDLDVLHDDIKLNSKVANF